MYNWMHRRANISKSQTQATLKDDETERGSATLRLDVKSLGNVGKQEKTANMTNCIENVLTEASPGVRDK